MIGSILGFLGTLVSPITEVVKGKQAIKKAITDSNIEKIRNNQMSDIDMDKLNRESAGLMDDISFYIFLSPAVLAFYPPALPHIKAGFIALEGMPQWFQLALGMMLISVWGYRKLVGPIITSIATAYLGKLPK
tara:strand:+ start:1522 stop:1920 length:399 start_codon:yes stop_codon:yes gene_type:complete